MKMKTIIICFSLLQATSYSQFPLAVGNRWDLSNGYWNGSGDFGADTVTYNITSDTLMPNGHKYFRITPASNYFKDFVRADSIGIYYYDTSNNKEWLFYKYDIGIGLNGYPDSEYISTGYMMNDTDTSNFIKIYKASDGKQLIFGDSVRVITYSVDTGLDNSYFITISPKLGFIGTMEYSWIYYYNSFIIGCVLSGKIYGTLTAIEKEQTFPVSAVLYQNYPNPFNPSTKIRFRIANSGFVSLKVYDVLGREVANLVNEQKPAGEYEINFDGSNLSSGTYFYRISVRSNKFQSSNFIQTKKLLLLK